VANAEQRAQRQNVPLDVDALHVRYAVVNEGPTLKRFTSAAMGRATPIKKRTSHVEIHVFAADQPKAKPAAPPAAAAAKSKTKEKAAAAGAKTAKAKTTKRKKA
jgi:large subunit ribosomal protein L22